VTQTNNGKQKLVDSQKQIHYQFKNSVQRNPLQFVHDAQLLKHPTLNAKTQFGRIVLNIDQTSAITKTDSKRIQKIEILNTAFSIRKSYIQFANKSMNIFKKQ
jgi:hypothetical protein